MNRSICVTLRSHDDAVGSHEPKFARLKPAGPIPHYAEKGLIVLLMSTIAFCVSHVVLEAFSDIRDVVFRKGGKEHDEHA